MRNSENGDLVRPGETIGYGGEPANSPPPGVRSACAGPYMLIAQDFMTGTRMREMVIKR